MKTKIMDIMKRRSSIYTSSAYTFFLMMNIALSGIFTFFIVTIGMTGFIAEGNGVNDYGILLSIGWVVALLMTIYTHKKKSKRWFILTIIAGWLLPIANIYVYGYVSDVVERLF